MIPSAWVKPLALVGLGVVAGMVAEWRIMQPKPSPIQKAAPAVVQKDGSRILESKPSPKPKAAQVIPKGAVVEGVAQVTIRPTLAPIPTVAPGTPISGDAALIHVDLSLVKMSDGQERVIASSPDGEVVGGVAIPTQVGPPIPKQLKYAAGPSYGRNSLGGASKGIVAERDCGPFRFGAYAGTMTIPVPGGQLRGRETFVWALIRF